ncbi:MAG: glycosyl transferase family 2 [Verrucomicrobiales bacterium]|nr:glycosyl transferase family 2 [Verrucomicrobiales bacterium]
MPLVTVILPTRKRNHLLPRALQSALAQTWRDFEIIIVDDNLPEMRISTVPQLKLLLRDPRIRVIENPNQRSSAAIARNVGLRIARGEWLTYLDDDDAYHPQKLEKQLQRARETNLPVGLCGLAYNLAGGRRRLCQVSHDLYLEDDLLLDAAADTKAIFHRRSNNVWFNENLPAAEDAYFFQSLLAHWKLNQVFNIPEALIEVFPQRGPRVNTNAEGLWLTNQKIIQDFAHRYSARAISTFMARAQLQDLKLRPGGFGKTIRAATKLFLLRGPRETRLILNACLYKVPVLRSWLKS